MRLSTPALSLLLAAGFATGPVRAAESFDGCKGYIDALPAVISTQGVWCLRADLATAINSGSAILVTTNNVTIDCNHYKLGGLAAGVGTNASGIRADDRLNVSVRNCNVRGFLIGATLGGNAGGGHLVEDNRFEGNRMFGLLVGGDGSLVRRNQLLDTGGTPLEANIAAIHATGQSTIEDNQISGLLPAQDGLVASAISVENGSHSVVQGNVVTGMANVMGAAMVGVFSNGSAGVVVRGNTFTTASVPTSYGVVCNGFACRCRDNYMLGTSTATLSCWDDGGNIHSSTH